MAFKTATKITIETTPTKISGINASGIKTPKNTKYGQPENVFRHVLRVLCPEFERQKTSLFLVCPKKLQFLEPLLFTKNLLMEIIMLIV